MRAHHESVSTVARNDTDGVVRSHIVHNTLNLFTLIIYIIVYYYVCVFCSCAYCF